ncbi:hypothetical protein COB72_04270 [bacterium]|nr:MAG: hypothetical protein COB72_04270 [bacterium]
MLMALVLGAGFPMFGGGCSASSSFTPTGNPLLDLRNPELLERDRVQAARLAWDEVEKGVRVRERTRKALKNLAWSNATSSNLRLTVLELLMSDQSEEGNADSRAMARLLLPTERSPDAVRIMAKSAVDGNWTELVPALVRSYARMSPNVPDSERDERAALIALRPDMNIERTVFDVFLNPSAGSSDVREQAVLRLSQRTRDDAWALLARLDESGDLRRALIDANFDIDAEAGSRVMVADLRAAQRELGVMPDTAMEIAWLSSLRQHVDQRNQRLNTQWWAQTAKAVSTLMRGQRDGLELRHLEAIRWASINRPAWLTLDRDGLFGVADERLSNRTHHKRKSQKGEMPRKERLGDWAEYLTWADLLTILVVDDAIANAVVAEQIFTQRTLDKKDTSTEYGGIIEQDANTGFRAVLYRPRSRDRLNDQRFVASDDMFRYSDRSLVHYHMHADKRNNNKYAGPSGGDFVNAQMSGRTNLVFTSLGKNELNVDLYFPNGVVIDLGQLFQQK